MKICVFGPKNSPEIELLIGAAEELGHECKKAKLVDVYMETVDSKFKAEHRKLDLLDYDIFIFRGLNKNLSKGLVLAEYLHSMGKTIIDDCLVLDRWSYHYIPLKLSQHHISYFTEITAEGIKASRDILMEIEHPIVIKVENQEKKNEIVFSDDWIDSYDFVRTTKANNFLFRKASEADFYYQIYVIGEEVVGCLKKTPIDEKFKLNYSKDVKTEIVNIDDGIRDTALKAAKVLNLDVASFDIVLEDGHPYILDANRAPRFVKFQKATEINFAQKVIEFAVGKARR